MNQLENESGLIEDESPAEGEAKVKKKKKKAKGSYFLLGGLALAAFLVLGYLALSSGNPPPEQPAQKSRDVLAQEQQLQKQLADRDRTIAGFQDQVLDKPVPESGRRRGAEGEKYGDLLQYLKSDPYQLASENFIGQEELSPNPGLRGNLLEQGSVQNRSRAIYRNRSGEDLDPKYQREDYEADKQSFFAFSSTYEGATYFSGGKGQREPQAARPAGREPPAPPQGADEFAGLSEEEITRVLQERYMREAAGLSESGGQGRSQARRSAPAVPIIYNELDPVKCFEGQFIDCVLLHKLVVDTEESPVTVAVAKDFFDASARFVVIPAGTRVVGRSQVVNYHGASRLYIWFERLIMPNGVSVNLPQNGRALDSQGSLGVASNVNRHFFMKYGSAIMVGLLDGLSGLAQSSISDYQMRNMFGRTSENFAEVNREMMKNTGNIVPTISVNPGHRLKLNISADIIISAYSLIADRSYARRGKR